MSKNSKCCCAKCIFNLSLKQVETPLRRSICPKAHLWYEFRQFTLTHLNEINELMEKHKNDINILNFLEKIRETCLKTIDYRSGNRCYTCGEHFIHH